jgi:enoyl-CoA hydratase/carnithine racemase
MQNSISKSIESYSQEVAALATSQDVLIGIKGLLVGAALSLKKAHELGFVDNVDVRYAEELDETARQIATGNVPEQGAWLAGFYFNSALLRFAAAYHILLKLMFDNIDESRKVLSEKAVMTGRVHPDDVDLLDKIYQDTNDFKHEGDKLLRYRRVQSVDDAIRAGRKLISLLALV